MKLHLPVIEGTLIRLETEWLPQPTPLWLWTSQQGLDPGLLDTIWSAWLRRFDIEHTFRFLKQTLGWTIPQVRAPEAADLRLPWEAPAAPGCLTPARVRRAFPNLHQALPRLTRAPKPSKPGPGRPPGQRNRRKAPIRDPGKKAKRDKTMKKREKRLKSTEA